MVNDQQRGAWACQEKEFFYSLLPDYNSFFSGQWSVVSAHRAMITLS
jgi:hypothetical protein